MSFYFGFYDYCRKKEFNTFISGSIAGLMNWTLTYPIDVIESRQIAQDISIKDALKQGKLWKGYGVCATRAIIVNAAIFSSYEQIKKLLEQNNIQKFINSLINSYIIYIFHI